MKINFDTIQKDLHTSFQSTLTSSSIFPSINPYQQINHKKHYNDLTHSMLSNTMPYQNKPITFSQLNHKPHTTSLSNSNLFTSNELKQKIPKKFSNIKTIQDMESFIKQMDHSESNPQLKSPSKSNQHIHFDQFNFNKTLPNITSNNQQLNDKKHQIEQVTSRLYQTFKDNNEITSFCKRKSCKQMISTMEKHSTEDLSHFTGQPNIDRIQSRKNLQQKLYHSINTSVDKNTFQESREDICVREGSKIHEKLFRDAKRRRKFKEKQDKQFEMKCIELSKSLQTKRRLTSQEQCHLSSSRGFYERLAELTQRHKNRSKLCQLVYSPNSYLLQTNRYKKHKQPQQNKSTAQIQKQVLEKAIELSKKLTKCTKPKCQQIQQHIKSQQLIPIQQIPQINDRTKQIIHQTEISLLKKLKGLFYEKQSKRVRINSAKIYTLSQKEFSILFELIRKVQMKSVKPISQKKLQQMISKFYHNLGFSEKQQLRRTHILSTAQFKDRKKVKQHQSKLKNNQIKLTSSKKRSGKKVEQGDRNLTDCSSFDTEVDYCARLAMFV